MPGQYGALVVMSKEVFIVPKWIGFAFLLIIGGICTSAYFPLTFNGGEGIIVTNNNGNITIAADTAAIFGTSITSSAGTLALSYGNDYHFSGTTTTWTAPAINANIKGKRRIIMLSNEGTGNITVNSNSGGTDFRDNFNTAISTFTLSPGEAVDILPSGTLLKIR